MSVGRESERQREREARCVSWGTHRVSLGLPLSKLKSFACLFALLSLCVLLFSSLPLSFLSHSSASPQTLQSFWLWTLLYFRSAKHKKSRDKLKTLKSGFDKVIECVYECLSECEWMRVSAWGWILQADKKKQTSMDSFVSETGRQAADPQQIKWNRSWQANQKNNPNRKTWYEIICQRHFPQLFPTFHFISLSFSFLASPFSPLFFFFVLACAAFWFCGRRQRGKGNGDSLPAPAPATIYSIYSLHSVHFGFGFNPSSFPWNCMPNGADMQWQTSTSTSTATARQKLWLLSNVLLAYYK